MTEPNATWQRWLVFVISTAGFALAAYAMAANWHAGDGPLRLRLYDAIVAATCIAMFFISWMIAWRGGHSVANLSMALALTAIYFNDTLSITFTWLHLQGSMIERATNALIYVVATGLFFRAAQNFPLRITAERVAGSRLLSALLRPLVMWPAAVVLSLAAALSPMAVAAVARLGIIAIGIAFFYVNYRRDDAEVRRKVLWFLAAAVASGVIAVISPTLALLLDFGNTESTLRTVIGVGMASLESLAILTCISAAVFYAGAISPSLVIRKTVVYGATTALLLFVFATVEVFIHHQLVHFLHVTDTFASSLIGGAFGLTFHPVKHYFEHLLKRIQGRRRLSEGVSSA